MDAVACPEAVVAVPLVLKAMSKVEGDVRIIYSREPVNPTVPGVSLLPIGAFAKAWIGVGSTLDYEPVALNATRTAEQLPLQGAVKLGKDLLRGKVRKRGPTLQVEDLITHLVEVGMPRAQAKAAVAQFLTARATRRTIA